MFDIDQCYDALKSERNRAYFWSGLGPEGQDIAAKIAQKNEGTTLEKLMEDNKEKLIQAGFEYDASIGRFVFDIDKPDNIDAWRAVSNAYAEQAQGEVHVVLGDNVRDESVWNTKEFPALSQNENVTKITSVDANGQDKEVLLDRTNGHAKSSELHANNISSKNIASAGGGGARAPDEVPQGLSPRSETTQPPNPKQNGTTAPAGAKKDDLSEIKSPKTPDLPSVGPENPSQITPVEDSTVLKSLSDNKEPAIKPENEVVYTAKKAAGGMMND